MSNHKRRFQYAVLFCMAALGIGLLAGCANPAADPGFQQESGGVEIRVSSGAQGSTRTLYPETTFTKYVLSFAGPGTESHDDVVLEGQASTVVMDLASGEWDITATGYVTILDQGTPREYEAAQGSGQVTVGNSGSQSLTIPISARQEGAPGFFSYSVSFPSSKVTAAELRLTDIGGGSIYLPGGDRFTPVDLLPSGKSGQVQLTPGYYVLSVGLQNQYQTAGHTEVIHIYANMETKADFTFTDTDFTDFITLSGTINVTVDDQVPSSIYIIAYSPVYGNLGYVYLDSPSENESWSIPMAPFEEQTDIRFGVEIPSSSGYISKENIAARTVQGQSISGIALNMGNIGRITLSGTIRFTDIPATLQEVYLYSYQVNNGSRISINLGTMSGGTVDGTWSITIPAFEALTTISWRLDAYDGSSWYYKDISTPVEVYNQSIANINLGTVSLAPSGEVGLQVNTAAELEYQLQNYVTTYTNGTLSHSSSDSYFEIYSYGPFDSYRWIVDGVEKSEWINTPSQVFYARDYEPGVHYVTMMVTLNGLLGSREFSFTVVE